MKVFLTGGSGYIGSAVALALKKAGHDVLALVRSEAK
ncbi:MAG TPA: NAD-dependent epimerase/dehydratase family protein, partial [Myxococcales bacterium]|nr:NAD-dependent epimerase/dehydratase family protein [Myxococcales bacterium]